MSRTLKVAAVQMDAQPAPVTDRLGRAARLVTDAAAQGAQLVVLPEVFNTGYTYHEINYTLAERPDGQTMTWMLAQAAQHNVHLAGTFLLLDGGEIYNTAFLVAPDGRTWRYDKRYPFSWERAYFRAGSDATIAHTELGKLGMMICWDHVHPELWAEYAGKVDAMVIMSCSPAVHKADLVFPDGERIGSDSIPALRKSYSGADMPFGSTIDQQAAWLGVPVVHSEGAGKFDSTLPAPLFSVGAALALRPQMWGKLLQARRVRMESDYYPQTKVVSASGHVLSRVETEGDSYTLTDITLNETHKAPNGRQPRSEMSVLSRLLADKITPAVVASQYERGLAALGYSAKPDPRRHLWLVVGITGLLSVLLIRLFTRKR
ncbi:MAG: carbon-nitrogen hydrolase family protein [Chloroflexota bacterium]|nr:carbon-nitrogen hydrolase family protein [Chloroflexota bacterium]